MVFAVAGYTAPGLLNAPNANTQSLTAAAWTTTPVAATVFSETMAMITNAVMIAGAIQRRGEGGTLSFKIRLP